MRELGLIRRAGLAALLAASIGGATTARGDEPSGYQAPALGTLFIVDTGWFRVVEVLADAVVTENAGKGRATWLHGLVNRTLSDGDRTRLMTWFPLERGKRFEYEIETAKEAWHHVLAVAGSEQLQVGVRSFEVFRVTRFEAGLPPNFYRGEYTQWYAPELGFPLKMTYRHIEGTAPNFTPWQVVRIVPPGSIDGVWSLDVRCSDGTFVRLPEAIVTEGVVTFSSGRTTSTTATASDLKLSQSGDRIELQGTMMNAAGNALVISARGGLVGNRVSGTGTINTRSGCAFTAERR